MFQATTSVCVFSNGEVQLFSEHTLKSFVKELHFTKQLYLKIPFAVEMHTKQEHTGLNLNKKQYIYLPEVTTQPA